MCAVHSSGEKTFSITATPNSFSVSPTVVSHLGAPNLIVKSCMVTAEFLVWGLVVGAAVVVVVVEVVVDVVLRINWFIVGIGKFGVVVAVVVVVDVVVAVDP